MAINTMSLEIGVLFVYEETMECRQKSTCGRASPGYNHTVIRKWFVCLRTHSDSYLLVGKFPLHVPLLVVQLPHGYKPTLIRIGNHKT